MNKDVKRFLLFCEIGATLGVGSLLVYLWLLIFGVVQSGLLFGLTACSAFLFIGVASLAAGSDKVEKAKN